MTRVTDSGMAPVVRLEHAGKSYNGVEVLRDISLEVRSGEVVAVIGPSGGGKSTLLRCLALLDRLDNGGLWYGEPATDGGEIPVAVPAAGSMRGTVYGDRRVLARARRRFGLVFQNFNLFPHMTVLQNVMDAPIAVQRRDPAEVRSPGRGPVGEDGPGGVRGQGSLSTLGWPAPAREHRAGAGDRASHPVFRRADLGTRPRAHGGGAQGASPACRRGHDDGRGDADRDGLRPRRRRTG